MANKQTVTTPIGRLIGARTSKWLINEVETYHERPHEGRPDPGWFHPSDLSTKCDAAMMFAYLGVKQRRITPAKLQRIFDHGHGRDRFWKEYNKKAGLSLLTLEIDRKIAIPHCRIRGEMDDLVINRVTNEKYVFEFKTKREDLFERLRAPDPDHIIQIHPYMFATGVLQTYVLYECKNCQDLKEFVVKFDTEVWRRIEGRCLRIMKMAEEHQTPERVPLRNDSECGWFHVCTMHDFAKAGTP